MADMPHLVAGDKIPEELYRITEAYLREHDMPVAGMRLNADLCNKAIDWWNALQVNNPETCGRRSSRSRWGGVLGPCTKVPEHEGWHTAADGSAWEPTP